MSLRSTSMTFAAVLTAAACASGSGGGAASPSPTTPAPAASAAPPATAPAPRAAPVAAAARPAGPVSTLLGVYSDAQAKRGEATFNAICLSCHVPTDYTGDAFQSKFVGGTVFDMYEGIRTSMPQDNPGSLTNQQYTDLVAFLFKLNGLPTRASDLPAVADSMKAIKVEAKPPQSLLRHETGMHHYGSTHLH